jgi:hypothetical protein
LFIAHLGLFILWQPFVHTGQRLSLPSLLAVLAVALLAGVYLQGWMITLWIMMLAGIVGGKVLLYDTRAARLFYLLALAFLVLALTLLAAPLAVPRPSRRGNRLAGPCQPGVVAGDGAAAAGAGNR